MKCIAILFVIISFHVYAQEKSTSGNPVFAGWYADPEGVILKGKYWIYPTYSDVYDKQVFFDAFSSSDLITWTKDRKSTRLNSSHSQISYAVFCLKKKRRPARRHAQ